MIRWGAYAVLLGGLIMIGVWGLDRVIETQVFYPDRVLVAQPGDLGLEFRDIYFKAADGIRLHAWFLPAPGDGPTLLFCHGNAGNISHRLDNIAQLNRLGLSVFAFDYRGYGLSEGKIGEQGFYADAEAALARVRELARGGSVIVFGRSLGGAAAVYLAANFPVNALVLESTFTNLADMAKTLLPLPGKQAWLAERFNSLGRIKSISAPLLFFHGDADDLVPHELGRRLFEAAPEPKQWKTVSGAGHNDVPTVGGSEYWSLWREFISQL